MLEYFYHKFVHSKHPSDVLKKRHAGTLWQNTFCQSYLAHLFLVLRTFECPNLLHYSLFLHLKQIAPPKLAAIIKSFSSLGACRKSAERQSEEKQKTLKTCPGGAQEYTHGEGIVCRGHPKKIATQDIPNYATVIGSLEKIQQGDVFAKPGIHVMLFKEFANEKKTEVIIIDSTRSTGKVSQRVENVALLFEQGYQIYRKL